MCHIFLLVNSIVALVLCLRMRSNIISHQVSIAQSVSKELATRIDIQYSIYSRCPTALQPCKQSLLRSIAGLALFSRKKTNSAKI